MEGDTLAFPRRARRRHTEFPAETALLVYLLLAAASTWLLRPPYANWILLGHGLAIGVFGILRQALPPPSPRAQMVRALFPLAMFPALLRVAGLINVGMRKWILDKPLERFESALFGLQPSIALSKWLPSFIFSEVLHVAYLSFYPLLLFLPLVFAAQKRQKLLATTVYGLCICFFVSLCFSIWLPVTSPLYRFPPLATPLRRGLAYRLTHTLMENAGVIGATFPSSHVSLATFNWFIAFRFNRRVFWLTALPTLGIYVGAVYGRFSFGVDVIAGILLATLCYRLLRRRFDRAAKEEREHVVENASVYRRLWA